MKTRQRGRPATATPESGIILVSPACRETNPRPQGSFAALCFEHYEGGPTVADYLSAMVRRLKKPVPGVRCPTGKTATERRFSARHRLRADIRDGLVKIVSRANLNKKQRWH